MSIGLKKGDGREITSKVFRHIHAIKITYLFDEEAENARGHSLLTLRQFSKNFSSILVIQCAISI